MTTEHLTRFGAGAFLHGPVYRFPRGLIAPRRISPGRSVRLWRVLDALPAVRAGLPRWVMAPGSLLAASLAVHDMRPRSDFAGLVLS